MPDSDVSVEWRLDDVATEAGDTFQRAWTSQGWTDAAEGVAASVELIRLHHHFVSAIDGHLKPLSLSFARYEILMQLIFRGHDAATVGALSDALQVHPTSVSSAVSGLSRSDYVVTTTSTSDRRRSRIRITVRGRDAALRATRIVNDTVFTRLGLTSKENESLLRVLERLRANAGDF